MKFDLTDFSGNSVGTATAEIKAQIDDGTVGFYGNAVYGDTHYQYNLDTSLLNGAIPGATLTIIISLDDGTEYRMSIGLK